jgi:hypothetical protein
VYSPIQSASGSYPENAALRKVAIRRMDAMYSKAAEFLAAVRGRVTVLDLDLEPSKAKEGSARMSIIY